MLWDWRTLGKHFLPPAGCGSIFLAKSCQDAWRSGSQSGEYSEWSKICSPICSTFGALVVGCAAGHCHGAELGPFGPAGSRCCSFQCISSVCWAYFSDVMILPRFQKAVMNQTSSRPPNSDHDLFFSVQIWLWEVLWSFFSVQPLNRSSPYKIQFSSHVTIQLRNDSLLLHRIREDDTSKQFFWFAISLWGTHFSSFLTFPICFKCQTTIEWSALSSSATSHVVVGKTVLIIALN